MNISLIRRPSGAAAVDGTRGTDWHVEDVTEFRNGPSGRFAVHIT